MGQLIALNPNGYLDHKPPKEGTLTSGHATTCHMRKSHASKRTGRKPRQSNNYKNCKNRTKWVTENKCLKAEGGGSYETCPIGKLWQLEV